MLTISVKNFGPIAEGSVDLKPLTIFVGPSNTGKSYMATAVYAVMRAILRAGHMRVHLGNYHEPVWETAWARIPELSRKELSGEVLKAFRDWSQWFSNSRWSLSDESEATISSLPDVFRSWLEDATTLQLAYLQEDVTNQVRQFHGEDSSFLKVGNDPGEFQIRVCQDSPKLVLLASLENGKGPRPSFDISQMWLPDFMFNLPSEFWQADSTDLMWPETARGFISSVSEGIFAGLPGAAVYLPAGRSGITQVSGTLAAAQLQQSRRVGLSGSHLLPLPGAIATYLNDVLRLRPQQVSRQQSERLQESISFIETQVLHGRVDFDESSGLPIPRIVYVVENATGEPAQKFSIDQSSSMVSELAPLILFLKHLVRPGDLLILEEPESHLHPAAQRQLARGIVRLVNAGVKVLITTHSDIIISQVNNLLALRQASPEMVEQGGFEPEDFLDPEQVGAYLFRHSQKLGGCETVPLEIDPDTGIDEDEFAAVFESIYDESIALQRDRN